MAHHRYPGPGSFADNEHDSRVFFGRTREIAELADRITADRLVVLYGKSGLGKTSLLQAGLFPRLRAARILPVRLRPISFDEDNFAIITRAVAEACVAQGYEFTPGEGESLWEYFHTALISQGDKFLDPVLVFDQFEEVFTRKDAEFRNRLGEDLRFLLSALAPPTPRVTQAEQDDERRRYPPQPPNVRIVFSLREEYVGALDEFAGFLPGLLSNRFRLQPLSREAARVAIENPPGETGVVFASEPFTFVAGEVDKILDFLVDKYGNVEPIELQIICQHIERQVVLDAQTPGFDAAAVVAPDPARMKDVLGEFYLESVAPASLSGGSGFRQRREARRVRRLCEYGLVSDEGFRETLPQRRIEREFKVQVATLDKLVDARLVRREDRLNDNWYELTHDRIAGAVKANRRSTGPVWLGIAAVLFVVVAFVLAQQYADYREKRAVAEFAAKIKQGDSAAIAEVLPGIQLLSEQRKRDLFFDEMTRDVFLKYFEQRIREKFDPQAEEDERYEYDAAQLEIDVLERHFPYPDLVAELRGNLTTERESLVDAFYGQLDVAREASAQTAPDFAAIEGVLEKLRVLDRDSRRVPAAYTQFSEIARNTGQPETALSLIDTGLGLLGEVSDSDLEGQLKNLRDQVVEALAEEKRNSDLEADVRRIIAGDFSQPPDAARLRELAQVLPDSDVALAARERVERWLGERFASLAPDDPAARILLEDYTGVVSSNFRDRWLGVFGSDSRQQNVLVKERRAEIEQLLRDYRLLVESELSAAEALPVTDPPAQASEQNLVDRAANERGKDVALSHAMSAFEAASVEADEVQDLRQRIGGFYVEYARALRGQQRIASAQRQLLKAMDYIPGSTELGEEESALAATQAALDRAEQERLVAGIETLARTDPAEAKRRLRASLEAFPKSSFLQNYHLPDPCGDRGLVGNGNRRRATCRDALTDDLLGPALVVIPAGEVFAGRVAVSRYEISVGDYDQFCSLTGECVGHAGVNPALPVTNLSVEAAQAYVEWLTHTSGWSYRLPTSAEWVYAANAQDARRVGNVNCRVLLKNQMVSGLELLPVNVGQPNSWGLVNTVGNAREWAKSIESWEARGGAYTDSISRCSIDLAVAHPGLGYADEITGFRVLREIPDS